MDQVSLFVSGEEEVYAALEPKLRAVLEENWVDPALLRLDPRKTYSSILFGSSVAARLSGGASPSLSVLKGDTPIPGAADDGNFEKVALESLSGALDYAPFICAALQTLIDRIPRDFSCCSRYRDCSEQKACVNPDRGLALGCAYRKILHSGRVFYGENRNV